MAAVYQPPQLVQLLSSKARVGVGFIIVNVWVRVRVRVMVMVRVIQLLSSQARVRVVVGKVMVSYRAEGRAKHNAKAQIS